MGADRLTADPDHHFFHGETMTTNKPTIIFRNIEMGVLSDGTPFLTGRSLARLCGIAPSTTNEWGEFTPKEGDRLRAGKMAVLLAAQGFEGDRFF